MFRVCITGDGLIMRTTMRLIVLAAVALTLGGCVASGSLAARGVSIDQGVGSLSNRAILLNLARASQAEVSSKTGGIQLRLSRHGREPTRTTLAER